MALFANFYLTANDINNIRTLHSVRELAGNEEGSPIDRLPNGVYGFTYSPGQDEMPVFANKSYHCFEIHKLGDGSRHIVGYVTPAEAAALKARTIGTEASLYPDPFGQSNELVTVDLSRTLPARRTPAREDGNPFRIVLAQSGE